MNLNKKMKNVNQHKGFEHRIRTRARSSHRGNENTKLQLNRSHSVEHSEKILNVDSKYDMLCSVSQTFESILNELEIGDDCEEIYEILVNIQSVISKKISSLKCRIKKKQSLKVDLEPKNLNLSKTLSVQSLHSEVSESDYCLRDDSFLTKVDCPFCTLSQPDRRSLIKHLDECEPHKYKEYEQHNYVPFSVFQILPNNSFKCNICPNSVQRNFSQYVTHLHAEKHVSAYSRLAQTKNYSEYLFCSCCKVQVPNNYTQLDFHIRHEVHKSRSDSAPNTENFLQKGIHAVFIKSKKFKCLDCPLSLSVHESTKEILKHFEDPRHIRNTKKNVHGLSVNSVYCEFCCKTVHVFEIINHFSDKEHKKNVEKMKENDPFELCLYCGFLCNDLRALSWHMETKCQAVNDIREELGLKKDTTQVTRGSNKTEVEDDANEECFIVVKDNLEIPKLFKYFTKFGVVTGIETCNDKDVKIKFREKSSVEDILLLQNVLQMEGVKLNVTTEEKVSKANKTTNSIETVGGNKNSDVSDSFNEGDSNSVPEDDELQNLFARVSSHLANNAQKMDCHWQEKLAEDCAETLEIQSCRFVGFSACGLLFPVESLSLYCSVDSTEFLYLRTNDKFETNLLKKFYIRMCDSALWKNVKLNFDSPFPSINCEHKETQKSCTVVIARAAMLLTNMLKVCLEKEDVRHFCLIIRFWLSVHELEIRNSEYTIISILIFFLINKGIVKFPADVFKIAKFRVLEEMVEEEFGFKKPTFDSQIVRYDVQKLFQEFLLFLDSFDFDNYVICAPIQHPLPKTFLMSRLVRGIFDPSTNEQALESPMCILELVSFINVAENVEEEDKKSLLKIVSSTIEHYKIQ